MKSWPELIGSGNPENGDYLAGLREAQRERTEATAYFDVGNVRYPLIRISVGDMNTILKDERTKNLVGYPVMFDDTMRLYPKQTKGLKVVFK